MSQLFFKKFKKKVPIDLDDEKVLRKYITTQSLKKGEHFLRSGEITDHISFIEKGSLRAYVLNPKGDENVVLFGIEGWTMGDLNSFIKQEPATYNIDALEDSELVLISKSAHDCLLKEMPKYETYQRILMTDAYMAIQKRTSNGINLPLEKRYQIFVQTYPKIAQRVPQYMVASYMGIAPETLSRIRAKKD